MGCRCENSISFRLSQGVATIFVFGVRARALPLNVLRGGERTEDEAAKGRRRRSSVPGVKRPAKPSRLALSVPGRVLGDVDGTRSENLSRATCSRSMTNLPDACQTFAVRDIPWCRAKISIQNVAVLIKFKGHRSSVRATLRYHQPSRRILMPFPSRDNRWIRLPLHLPFIPTNMERYVFSWIAISKQISLSVEIS